MAAGRLTQVRSCRVCVWRRRKAQTQTTFVAKHSRLDNRRSVMSRGFPGIPSESHPNCRHDPSPAEGKWRNPATKPENDFSRWYAIGLSLEWNWIQLLETVGCRMVDKHRQVYDWTLELNWSHGIIINPERRERKKERKKDIKKEEKNAIASE